MVMQETRQHILEILKERNHATVDEIVEQLQKRRGPITAVTVRHHLTRLQQENLIAEPDLLHRSTPGRPQHVYALTEKAKDYFPNNYQQLLNKLLDQMQKHIPADGVNVILEGVADSMAADASIPDFPLQERVEIATEFLNQRGYNARWEPCEEGYILWTTNCPYHHIAETSGALCDMDMHLISSLLNVIPRVLTRASVGDTACSFLIPRYSS
jgi:predicted ArsR family transcriptional regulator